MNRAAIVISIVVVLIVFISSETTYSQLVRSYLNDRVISSVTSRCVSEPTILATTTCSQHTMFGSITKNGTQLYYDGVALTMPLGFNIETFSLLPGGFYGKDVRAVYDMSDVYRYGSSAMIEKIYSADPQTFVVLYDGGVRNGVRTQAYATDARHVYLGRQVLSDADPATFDFLTEHGVGCGDNQDGCLMRVTTKDKNCIYLDGEKVLDDEGMCVDPHTCIHNSLCAVN